MLQTLAERLEASALAQFIAASLWAFPTIETVHVLCVATVFGSIALVDLRLIGLVFTNRRTGDWTTDILPITWVAFAGAVVSGALLVTAQPTAYLANTPFRFKMLMLALAGANMAVFHMVSRRTAGDWDERAAPPPAARAAGALSLCLWVSVVLCGRWIGFTLS